MRKLTLLLCSLALLYGELFAQSRIISGKVVDEHGNPIPGASVQVRGTRRGTSTTEDGVFSISIPATAKTLVVSSVNYTTQDVPIADNLTITMKTAPKSDLSEVVVVAYGQQKKSDVTSAISTIGEEVIKNQQITTVGQALQGTAPGVLVVNTNGQPGEAPVIRIRGVASIAASADPLIVMDGVPYDGNLNMINPADIASFSVLKDAAATSLYGSRAANGVILITTKLGKRGAAPSVNVTGTYGISSRAVKDYSYLGTNQLFQLGWETMKNLYTDAGTANPADSATTYLISNGFHYNPYGPSFPNPVDNNGNLLPGTKLLWNDNWTKALTHDNAARRNVNASISGASDRSRYFFSLGYLNQDGYVIKSNYKRVNATLNYTTDVTDWFQVGARANIVNSSQNYPAQGDGTYSDVINYGKSMSSVFPIYARDDSGRLVKDIHGNPIYDYGKAVPGRTVNVNRPVLNPSNDVGTVNLDNWDYNRLLTNLNAYGQVKFTNFLSFRTNFGINRSTLDELHYENNQFGDAASVGGRTYKEVDFTTSYTWTNSLNYEQRFGDHHLEAMAIYEAYDYKYETTYGSKTGFPFNGQQQLTNATINEDFEGYVNEATLVSVLGRLKYDYLSKYFAEFTIRNDGASIFAPGYRYGTFPAGGVSWLITKEDFMKDITPVNFLKLRVSYGSVGNNTLLDPNGNRLFFPYLATFQSGNNDLTNPGVYLSQLANIKIQWERQLSSNVGLDFELWKSRLTGSIDLFRKNSNHLILYTPLTPSAGFGSILSNIGQVVNKGIEINLNYEILKSKDFDWSVGVNLTTLSNKITKLLPGQDTLAPKGDFRYVVGKSVNEFYMPVWAGVDPANGHGQWWIDSLDNAGRPTGKSMKTDSYTTAQGSEKWVGSGIPKVTGGFNTKFRYKSIDLSVLFNYAFGGKYYDNNYAQLMNGNYNGYGSQLDVDELARWNKVGQITGVPRLNQSANDEEQLSTRFLFSGNYIRLRNVTLGYTVPTEKIRKVLKSFRFYIMADNVYTWDKLKKGSDPESSIDGNQNGNAFPLKTWSAGLDLNF